MNWVMLIPALPALAFLVLLPFTRAVRRRLLFVPIAFIVTSLALSLAAFARVWPGGGHGEHGPVWSFSWEFAQIGADRLSVGLALDPVAAVMLLVVTIVGACVQIYSIGYMHKDERIGWYYAVVSLFTAAMLTLVLSENLLLTFAMWELMGLCSYLLIGFWYELEAPRKASMKAFMTTRVGDLGFLIALFAIFGQLGTFDIATIVETAPEWPAGVAAVVAGGLLWAAMGKSAQVPLHVWLPDAMAGPTPASALIHAATMVAAGVFVVARTLPVFEQAPAVMTFMLVIGALTAIMGALLASVQHDVKKVLAYSTISQLGLMFVALGAGSATAGLFHLTTHAFFKSLLFLGAGVIIHAAHTQDMREMGGLARHLPVTATTFFVGSAALAGLAPFAGFFSKDEILALLLHEHHYVIFGIVVVSSAITAFYVTRLWFRVFTGPEQTEHLHEGHATMLAPMVLLAIISTLIGFAAVAFAAFLGHEGEWPSILMISISTAIAVTGIGIGWWFYGRRSVVTNTRAWKQRFGYFYAALVDKFYFDLTYSYVFVRGYALLAQVLSRFDQTAVDGAVNGAASAYVGASRVAWAFDGSVVDGAVNGLATLSRGAGARLRALQSGRVQVYQRLILGAVVLLMLFFVLNAVLKGA